MSGWFFYAVGAAILYGVHQNPMILAGGASIMAVAGIVFFKEPASFARLLGIALALAGLFLLRTSGGK